MWVLIDEGKCVELRDEIQVFEWDLFVGVSKRVEKLEKQIVK